MFLLPAHYLCKVNVHLTLKERAVAQIVKVVGLWVTNREIWVQAPGQTSSPKTTKLSLLGL